MLVEKQSEIEQRLGVPLNAIAMFCRRWNIIEFATQRTQSFYYNQANELNINNWES